MQVLILGRSRISREFRAREFHAREFAITHARACTEARAREITDPLTPDNPSFFDETLEIESAMSETQEYQRKLRKQIQRSCRHRRAKSETCFRSFRGAPLDSTPPRRPTRSLPC